MSFMILAVVGVLIWIFILVSVISKKKGKDSVSSNDPLDILKERLAKGEISSYEYEDLKRTLDS